MSIYRPRRPDGSLKSPYWHFDFTIRVAGERRRIHGSTGEEAKARARKVEQAEKRRHREGRPNDAMTLAAACIRYCDEVSSNQPSAEDSAKALEHCARLIGGARRLATISADDIAEAVARRLAESYGRTNPRLVKPGTVNRQITEPMRRLLRRAKKVWGVSIDLDAFPWGELLLKEPPGRVREFSGEEAEAFWKMLRPDYVPVVTFLASRGFRVRATLGMVKKRMDLAGRRAQVWKKGEGFVWRALTAAQTAILQGETAKSPLPAVWTYVRRRGKERGLRRPITYSGLRRVLERTFRAAGIDDFRIHDLRHDFASKLLRATRDLALVRKALDHSSITSTVRYAHVLDEDVTAGMEMVHRNGPGIAVSEPTKTGSSN